MGGSTEPVLKGFSVNKLGLVIVSIILALSVITVIGVLIQTQGALLESGQQESLLDRKNYCGMDGRGHHCKSQTRR